MGRKAIRGLLVPLGLRVRLLALLLRRGGIVMAWIGPVVGAAAGVLGDVMSQQGQQQTNAMSTANMMQQEQWQTQMSNTAMTRRVADLRNAGLNPLLAVNTPGAQVGSVSPAQLSNPDASFGQLGSQVNNALQQATLAAQVKKANADADQSETEAARARATLPYSGQSAEAALEGLNRQNRLIWNQASNLEQDYAIKGGELEQLNRNNNFQQDFLQLKLNQAKLDYQAAQLGMPKLQNDAAWQKAHPELAGWMSSGTVDSALNTGAKVFNSLSPSKVLTGRIPSSAMR